MTDPDRLTALLLDPCLSVCEAEREAAAAPPPADRPPLVTGRRRSYDVPRRPAATPAPAPVRR